MYKNCDKKGKYISLHDCKADRIKLKDGNLTFYFKDGFWISKLHEKNNSEETRKTDAAKVKFHLTFENKYDISFYILKRGKKGRKRICKMEKIKKFISKVNKGKYRPEFLYLYKCEYNDTIVAECALWSKKRSSDKCYITMYSDKVKYYWYTLTDRTW